MAISAGKLVLQTLRPQNYTCRDLWAAIPAWRTAGPTSGYPPTACAPLSLLDSSLLGVLRMHSASAFDTEDAGVENAALADEPRFVRAQRSAGAVFQRLGYGPASQPLPALLAAVVLVLVCRYDTRGRCPRCVGRRTDTWAVISHAHRVRACCHCLPAV